MATIAIGDVHGQVKPLHDLLERVRPNISAGDTVVFLGDYIDRGRDTRACIDAILDFRASVPATIACLRGNHEEWMLETRDDHTRHSWLLGMNALTTIRSYSMEAAAVIADAANRARGQLYDDGQLSLPYEQFFEALPVAHRDFFDSLHLFHETPECLCTHGGVDPAIDSLTGQDEALIWGVPGFPESYAGTRPIVYGHHNNADIDEDDWPHPRIIGATYGLDTIAHGVLTAIRLPGPYVLQSARYERRRG